jgi:hypothetical protein
MSESDGSEITQTGQTSDNFIPNIINFFRVVDGKQIFSYGINLLIIILILLICSFVDKNKLLITSIILIVITSLYVIFLVVNMFFPGNNLINKIINIILFSKEYKDKCSTIGGNNNNINCSQIRKYFISFYWFMIFLSIFAILLSLSDISIIVKRWISISLVVLTVLIIFIYAKKKVFINVAKLISKSIIKKINESPRQTVGGKSKKKYKKRRK